MSTNNELIRGSIEIVILKLLSENDMYGYQMITALRERSDHSFDLKAGTLYPLLHTLEQRGYVSAREEEGGAGRPRRYYHLTETGRRQLAEKENEWRAYADAVRRVLDGGVSLAGTL